MALENLPQDLPAPIDDGGADHLTGMSLPNVTLTATNGNQVTLSEISGRVVIYIYPMTGRPDVALPDGWEQVPGARGCTPQSCSFRDHYQELRAMNSQVYGLSTQDTAYQQEAKERLHLPFEMLSDEGLMLKETLTLPMMNPDLVAGLILYKRMTLIAHNGIIEKVFYPVFPPDKNIDDVLNWLTENS
ncbi:MAG: peroxiredoxin [Chloroflexota bacterium]